MENVRLPLNIIEEEFDILNDEYKLLKKRNAKEEDYRNNARRMLIISHALLSCVANNVEITEEDKESALRMYNKIQEVKELK